MQKQNWSRQGPCFAYVHAGTFRVVIVDIVGVAVVFVLGVFLISVIDGPDCGGDARVASSAEDMAVRN